VPYGLWNKGVPHAFAVVYNATGIVGISVDDVHALLTPVSVDADTDGVLVGTHAAAEGCTVRVENVKLTVPGFVVYDVDDFSAAPTDDFLLIQTDLPLARGFIVSGTVTLTWTGNLPPPDEQWFEVAPLASRLQSIPCDANCDGVFDGADIDPFFQALEDPLVWWTIFPCDYESGNDANLDGFVDGADIDAFFEGLEQGHCG
jgi:hypothetical protein